MLRSIWQSTLEGFLGLSPAAGVTAGMVYAHHWAATHAAFLLQDFILVTMLALLVGLVVAPVAMVALHTALSAAVLAALLALGILRLVLGAARCAASLVAFAGLLVLGAVETVCAALAYPRCDFCGGRHAHPIVRPRAARQARAAGA